jgi:ABC-type branched-subunit amino acid transport system substrate-binding protein
VAAMRRRAGSRAIASGLLVSAALAGCSVSVPRHGLASINGASPGTGLAGQQGSDQGAQGGAGSGSQLAGGTSSGNPFAAGGGGLTTGSGTNSTSGTAASGATTSNSGANTSRGTTSGGTNANGKATAPGVTAKTITVSFLGGYGNSCVYANFWQGYYKDGWMTWVHDVNARGGIFGRTVVSRQVDDGCSQQGGQTACRQVIGNGSFMAVSELGATGADTAEANCLNQAHIPLFFGQPSAVDPSWSWVYVHLAPAPYSSPFVGFIQHIIHDGGGRIGIMYGSDRFNTAKRDGFLAAARAAGLNIVDQESYAPNNSNFTSQNARMSANHVSTVVFFGGIEYISANQEAQSIGWHPNWVGTDWASDEGVGICSSCYQGHKDYRWWTTTDSKAYQQFKALDDKYDPGNSSTTTTSSYYGLGVFTEKVLRDLGPSPTRAAVGPAIESITNYNNGIIGMSFRPGRHFSTPLLFPVTCCTNNSWTLMSPPGPKYSF